MNIIDLTEEYRRYIQDDRDVAKYIESNTQLFAHYFRFWTVSKKNFPTLLSKDEMHKRRNLLNARLKYIEGFFKKAGLILPDPALIVFVGKGVSNGHAYKVGRHFMAWICLEAYSSQSQIDVFVTHELVHALHYSYNPNFYFKNKIEKEDVVRQIITEGIATYVSKKLLGVTNGEVLWADYLDRTTIASWLRKCRKGEDKIKMAALEDIKCSRNSSLFLANNPLDILEYRAGYYLGFTFISDLAVAEKYSVQQLLALPRSFLEKRLHVFLKSASDEY